MLRQVAEKIDVELLAVKKGDVEFWIHIIMLETQILHGNLAPEGMNHK